MKNQFDQSLPEFSKRLKTGKVEDPPIIFQTSLNIGTIHTMRIPCIVLAAGLCMMLALPASADQPATAPVADDPAVKEVRDTLLGWDKTGADMSLEQTRKLLHADNEREMLYADYLAHESWQETKTQEAVRRKWGSEIEAKFAHLCGSSTLEDDQAADIKVTGDHAAVNWPIKELSTQYLVKVDGKWVVDIHPSFVAQLKDDPLLDKHHVHTARMMKQAAEDIVAGKYDDADSFLADIKEKLSEVGSGN
jgi:hypothetical protein